MFLEFFIKTVIVIFVLTANLIIWFLVVCLLDSFKWVRKIFCFPYEIRLANFKRKVIKTKERNKDMVDYKDGLISCYCDYCDEPKISIASYKNNEMCLCAKCSDIWWGINSDIENMINRPCFWE